MHSTILTLLFIVALPTLVSCSISTKDPTCQDGIVRGRICCHKLCGSCGGPGCGRRPGGGRNCCQGVIARSRRRCNWFNAPCFIDVYQPPMYMEYPVQEDYIPIIGYHRIGGPPSEITTTVKRFKEQVEYLTNVAGCNWITMERLSEYIAKKEKVPTKACVMTFDDAIATQYHNALCTLNKYKVPATYYLLTSFVGWKKYYLNWDEVEKLHRLGHDMEGHTKTHAYLPGLNCTEQEEEIVGCKRVLEEKGYPVKTFAYPYGKYNDVTLSILRKSDYVLVRETEHRLHWRNPKANTIRQNKDYVLHFAYIRPEFEDGKDLWERVKYTGWWQFEDNYVIIKGSKRSIRRLGGDYRYLPTNISYGVIRISKLHDELSTQFVTKQEGGFTLYLIAGGKTKNTPRFQVKIDDVVYSVYPAKSVYQSRAFRYFGFYVNIMTLLPGVHTLNIINNNGMKLYLDKFRLFSNVAQDFKEPVHYETCDPELDDYCQCDNVDENILV